MLYIIAAEEAGNLSKLSNLQVKKECSPDTLLERVGIVSKSKRQIFEFADYKKTLIMYRDNYYLNNLAENQN